MILIRPRATIVENGVLKLVLLVNDERRTRIITPEKNRAWKIWLKRSRS